MGASPLPGHSWEMGRAGTGPGKKETPLLLPQTSPRALEFMSHRGPRSVPRAGAGRAARCAPVPILQRTAALWAKPQNQGDSHLLPGGVRGTVSWHPPAPGDARAGRCDTPRGFGDLHGAFSREERAVSFYSPLRVGILVAENHCQVHFKWDMACGMTITLGTC